MTANQYVIIREDNYLAHHGVKGQKWGVRRYQNDDGSLTPEGRAQLARSQRYVTEKSRTAGSRVRRTLGAGLVGGLIPGIAGAGALTGTTAAKLASEGLLGAALSTTTGLGAFGGVAASGMIAAAPLIAAGALGGLAIAGIKHGVQAAKVRKGQKFMDMFSSGSRG